MTTVILPVIDEYQNLKSLIPEIIANIEPKDLIVIIDGKFDQKEWDNVGHASNSQIILLKQNNPGLGAALREGMQHALKLGADQIITMDADYSHNPKDLGLLKNNNTSGLSIGSRYIEDGKFMGTLNRKLLSRMGNILVRKMAKSNITDYTSGFRCYSSKVLNELNVLENSSNEYAFQLQLALRIIKNQVAINEVPIIFGQRHYGKTKFQYNQIMHNLQVLITELK